MVAFGGAQQDWVEFARCVVIGRAGEFIFEAKRIEEPSQHRVIMVPETFEGAKRIGYAGQRLVQVGAQHVLIGHVIWNLAHSVHVVGKAQQAGFDLAVCERLEGATDHAGARHLTECADVREAGGAVSGFEQDCLLHAAVQQLQTINDAACLLERPGAGLVDDFELGGGGVQGHEGWRPAFAGSPLIDLSRMEPRLSGKPESGGKLGAPGRQVNSLPGSPGWDTF